MRKVRWNISAAAILLAALIYFFDASGVVSALVPAALAHEFGHILSLRLSSRRLTRVSVSLTGIVLDYAPGLEGARHALCCLSGPLAGFIYAVLASAIGGAFLRMSGTVSVLLSCFNLLPTLPLDGGRIVVALLPERAAVAVSKCTALAMLLSGGYLALRHGSVALLIMGAWLAACNLRGDTRT